MDHLNYFYPHRRAEAHWEVPLTRAFFSLLKLCPAVHAQFIDRIREDQRELPRFLELNPREVIISLEGKEIPSGEGAHDRLVTLTGCPQEGTAQRTGQSRRYDVVLTYPTGFNLIVESKVGGSDDKDTTVNTGNELLDRIASITWAELIEDLWEMIECRLLDGSASALTSQFLDYVETEFSSLCPYSRLDRCRRNELRIQRRLHMILEDLGPTASDGNELDLGRGAIAQRAILRPDEGHVYVGLYPGIFMSQARRLYQALEDKRLLSLKDSEHGWRVVPTINLCFAATSCAKMNPRLGLEDYIEYWRPRAANLSELTDTTEDRSVFRSRYAEMVEHSLASESDSEDFRRAFLESKRTKMAVCPGLRLEYYWPIERAEDLDRKDMFRREVAAKICEGLEAWNQRPPDAVREAAGER